MRPTMHEPQARRERQEKQDRADLRGFVALRVVTGAAGGYPSFVSAAISPMDLGAVRFDLGVVGLGLSRVARAFATLTGSSDAAEIEAARQMMADMAIDVTGLASGVEGRLAAWDGDTQRHAVRVAPPALRAETLAALRALIADESRTMEMADNALAFLYGSTSFDALRPERERLRVALVRFIEATDEMLETLLVLASAADPENDGEPITLEALKAELSGAAE